MLKLSLLYPLCYSIIHIFTPRCHVLTSLWALLALKPPIYPALFPKFEWRNQDRETFLAFFYWRVYWLVNVSVVYDGRSI